MASGSRTATRLARPRTTARQARQHIALAGRAGRKSKERAIMSYGKAIAESLLRGATFGMSELLGVTGKDGIIHDTDDDPEKQAILVDEDGLYFIENKIQVGWDDVVGISDQSSEGNSLSQNALYQFELRGGLIVFSGWIAGNISEYMGAPTCTDADVADLDSADTSDENLEALRTGVANLFWARDIANEIRGSAHLIINERYLLGRILFGYTVVHDFIADSGSEDMDRVCGAIEDEYYENWEKAIRVQVGNLDEDDVEDSARLIASSFYCSCGWPSWETGKGIKHQKEVYDALRSARSWGQDNVDDDVKTILASTTDDDVPLGDDKWVNARKMIVCTDARSDLSVIDGGVKIANVMVMDARDIVEYNEMVEGDQKLKFESNHPQNGVSYVQHPVLKNTYIQLEAYHTTLLERKYDELKYVLTCLGAKTLELSAGSESSKDEANMRRRKVSGEANVDMLGDVSGEYSDSVKSSRMVDLCKTLSTRRVLKPKGKPYVPKDVEFYPTEQSWQRLAKLVLAGRIKSEEVALTYKNESAISGSGLRSISAKLHSTVPGYSFGVGGDFESEYENELKALESLTWNYKVVFDEEAESGSEDVRADSEDGAPKENLGKAEAMILGRAKRYAKTEEAAKSGILNDAQRADLEKLASKYGIDEFRLEELIDEAFV